MKAFLIDMIGVAYTLLVVAVAVFVITWGLPRLGGDGLVLGAARGLLVLGALGSVPLFQLVYIEYTRKYLE